MCGLLWLRLVIEDLGTADYTLVAVVVGLPFLLSFLDFGTASSVLEEAGRYRALGRIEALATILGRAWRVITVISLRLRRPCPAPRPPPSSTRP